MPYPSIGAIFGSQCCRNAVPNIRNGLPSFQSYSWPNSNCRRMLVSGQRFLPQRLSIHSPEQLCELSTRLHHKSSKSHHIPTSLASMVQSLSPFIEGQEFYTNQMLPHAVYFNRKEPASSDLPCMSTEQLMSLCMPLIFQAATQVLSYVSSFNRTDDDVGVAAWYRAGRYDGKLSRKVEPHEASQPLGLDNDATVRLNAMSDTAGNEASRPVETTVAGSPNCEESLRERAEESVIHGASVNELSSTKSMDGELPKKPNSDPHGAGKTSSHFHGNPNLRQAAVPSGVYSRIWNVGSLLGGLAANTVMESVKNVARGSKGSVSSSAFLAEGNADRISETLCRMRGAALKLGQMLSIQEEYLPPTFREALRKARDSAHAMPQKQLHTVLEAELGRDWKKRFASFSETPFAAASIGQVHSGVLHDGTRVAVKVQYPGIAESVRSDVKTFVMLAKVVPKMFFLDQLCRELEGELIAECDYRNEAAYYSLFRNLLAQYGAIGQSHQGSMEHVTEPAYYVPTVIGNLSTTKVLTTTFVEGVDLETLAGTATQFVRDAVGTKLLQLCLMEIFRYKVMNTDPNPANFAYSEEKDALCVIDFGASRYYPVTFVDDYLRLLRSAVIRDSTGARHYSEKLGFLVQSDTAVMVEAHVNSVMIVAEPFRETECLYSFGESTVVKRIHALVPLMLKARQNPPPKESYSIHRKLAGCYLLCMKLKSRVNARQIFETLSAEYEFSTPETLESSGIID